MDKPVTERMFQFPESYIRRLDTLFQSLPLGQSLPYFQQLQEIVTMDERSRAAVKPVPAPVKPPLADVPNPNPDLPPMPAPGSDKPARARRKA